METLPEKSARNGTSEDVMNKKGSPFSHPIRVRWGECDAQGIVFNAQYMNFIEVGQAEYFRNLGIRLYDPESRNRFDLVTVKATLEYLAPARIDDMLRIQVRMTRLGNSSLTMHAQISRLDNEQPVHRAEIIYVNYDKITEKSRPIPDDIRRIITRFERKLDD